jgi:hypothetical protein
MHPGPWNRHVQTALGKQGTWVQPIELSNAFEIHLTAALNVAELESFTQFCHLQSWKPLHIVLERGATVSQPMATIHGKGCEADAVSQMKRSAETFSRGGFKLVRTKIEFNITAPRVPETLPGDAIECGRYFEHHLKLRLPLGGPTAELIAMAQLHSAHWSRNALKQFGDGYEYRFLTLRHFEESKAVSIARCEALMSGVALHDVEIVKRESEYCVFDSKCDLDAGWLAGEGSSHV